MSDVILIDVADGIAVVTMHRPEARNAPDAALRRAVPRTLRELSRSLFDPAALAANREAIQARGRDQQG